MQLIAKTAVLSRYLRCQPDAYMTMLLGIDKSRQKLICVIRNPWKGQFINRNHSDCRRLSRDPQNEIKLKLASRQTYVIVQSFPLD
jgi:hypothetical protein